MKPTPEFKPAMPSEQEEERIHERVREIKGELTEFFNDQREAHPYLRPLLDRTTRGLEAVGIVALKETNAAAKRLADKMGADYDALLEMILAIQTGGPWPYAAALKDAQDPVVKTWIMLRSANNMGREREMDMTEREFLQDVERIKGHLTEALQNPEGFFKKSKRSVLEDARQRFRVEDGVPIAELDNGFVPMAIDGYPAGVLHDADGYLMVGAGEIGDRAFVEWGLHKELREDRGRPNVEFWVNDKGEALIKKLYPGFVVVLSRNFDLAKAIARSCITESKAPSEPPSSEALGHTRYKPTSSDESESHTEEWRKLGFLRRSPGGLPGEAGGSKEMVRVMDDFYTKLAYIKGQVVYLDALALLRKKKAAKNKEVTPEEAGDLAVKTEQKMEQKMEELRHLINLAAPQFDRLPPDIDVVIDMAGGAGDLGLAVSAELLASGRELKEGRIVDPFARTCGLDYFMDFSIDYLPFSEELREKVHQTHETLQESEITPDAIVVAKHACGDLSDSIIEKWVDSDSPMLVMMTCCQEKAAHKPARYDIPQADWEKWCKDSGKTNDPNGKQYRVGMEAMTKLDTARVQYLRRHGFEAELHQTNKFPKGDVIIARRKPRKTKAK